MVPIDTSGEFPPSPLEISKAEVEKAMSELNEVLKLYKERALSVSKKDLHLTETNWFLGISRLHEKVPGANFEKMIPDITRVPVMEDEAGESYIVAADGTVYPINKDKGLSVISKEVDGNVYGLFKDLVPWDEKYNKEDVNFLPLPEDGKEGPGFSKKSNFIFLEEEKIVNGGKKIRIRKPDDVQIFRFKVDPTTGTSSIRGMAEELRENFSKGGVLEK